MAPITVIETITITRPLKVIAFLCGALALALLVMSLASTDWLLAHGWRQGLFLHCVDEMAERPLPFGLEEKVGCYRVRDEYYIQFTAALCILALATDVFATLLTGLGLQSGDPLKKRKYYRLAISVMLASRKTFTLDYLFLTVEAGHEFASVTPGCGMWKCFKVGNLARIISCRHSPLKTLTG
ncbi:Transmembrane protein 47 [Daphnia magna]|uniref:Transmembrane protein 47 n=1 Tax=Daphnia magna TaxID=35525 RepID=A0A164IL54_9CRUS|nr:Transmembrane protein 47 [Daphnia magna]